MLNMDLNIAKQLVVPVQKVKFAAATDTIIHVHVLNASQISEYAERSWHSTIHIKVYEKFARRKSKFHYWWRAPSVYNHLRAPADDLNLSNAYFWTSL